MKFFSEVAFFTNADYMVECIKKNTAEVVINEKGMIDIAFGDNTDMYYIHKQYKTILRDREVWDSFLYYYEVLINYIHDTACASCKYEKTVFTEDKIRKLFNIGVVYAGY